MYFYREYLLFLLLLFPIFLILILLSKKLKKTILYPYVDIFISGEKKNINKSLKILILFFKIFLFLLSFIFLILFLSEPFKKTKSYEYLLVYIDNTPLLDLNSQKVDSIVREYFKEKSFKRILVYDNQRSYEYPFKKEIFFKGKIEKKDFVKRRFTEIMNNLDSPSCKSIFISDRDFERFKDDFDFLRIKRDPDLFIVNVYPYLKIFSKDDRFVKISTENYQKNIYIKSGMNNIDFQVESLNYISVGEDTILFENKIYFTNRKVRNLLDEKSVKVGLKILNYGEGEGDIIISSKDNIKKGIVFVKDDLSENQNVNLKIFFDDEKLKGFIQNGFDNLIYKRIAKINGKTLIHDDAGNRILTFKDDKFYVSVPLDTTLSNFIYTPGFLPLLKFMLDHFIEDKLKTEFLDFEYREELIDSNKGFKAENEPETMGSLKNLFFLLFIFCLSLFFITTIY